MTRDTSSRARSLTWELQGGNCHGLAAWWTRLEAVHQRARTNDAAAAAVSQVRAVCADCPLVDPCAERAVLDSYTGLAAGRAYLNGRTIPATTVIYRPSRDTA